MKNALAVALALALPASTGLAGATYSLSGSDLIVTVASGEAAMDATKVTPQVANIVKRGGGDLRAVPLPDYAGDFTVDGGCLVVDNRHDLGRDNVGTVFVNDGGTLRHAQTWGDWGDYVTTGKRFVFAGAPAEGYEAKFGRWSADCKSGRASGGRLSRFVFTDDATFHSGAERLKLGGTLDLGGHTLTFTGGYQTQVDGLVTNGGHVVWIGRSETNPGLSVLQSEGATIGFAPSPAVKTLTVTNGALEPRHSLKANGATLNLCNGMLRTSKHSLPSERTKFCWDGPVNVVGKGWLANYASRTNVMNVAGPITGSGLLSVGPGWLNLRNLAGSTFSGDVVIVGSPGGAVATEWSGVALMDDSPFFPSARSVVVTNGASFVLGTDAAVSLPPLAFGGEADMSFGRVGTNIFAASRPTLAGLAKTGTGTLDLTHAFSVTGETRLVGGTLRLPKPSFGHAGLWEGTYVDLSKGDASGQSVWCGSQDEIEQKIGDADWTYSRLGARRIFEGYPSVFSNGFRRATAVVYRGFLWNRSPTNETWQFAQHMTYRMNLRLNGVWSPFGYTGEGARTNVWTTVVKPGPNPLLVYSLSACWQSRQEPDGRFDGLGLSYDRHPVAGITNVAHFVRLDDGGSGALLTIDGAEPQVEEMDAIPAFGTFAVSSGAVLDFNGGDCRVEDLRGTPVVRNVRKARLDGGVESATLTVGRSWTPDVLSGGLLQFDGCLRFGDGSEIVVPDVAASVDRLVVAWARELQGSPRPSRAGWQVRRIGSATGGCLLVLVRDGVAVTAADIVATVRPGVFAPVASDRAFPNPLKGFRPDAYGSAKDCEYATVLRSYLAWNELENSATDGVARIRDFCDQKWSFAAGSRYKIIPRVYLKNGKDPQTATYHFPADMESDVWEGDAFTNRLVRMIEKLGRCWDDDPRIAWIQMGIYGAWGEHHTPSIPLDIQRLMGETFKRAFKRKKVLVRSGDDFTDFDFGYYWDSWAHIQQWTTRGQGAAPIRERVEAGRYLTVPIEGETVYDWGNYPTQPGDSPDDTLSDPVHTDFLEMTIRTLHCTALGWVARYNPTNDAIRAGAARIQKAFGYRYALGPVGFDRLALAGGTLSVTGSVRNVGSAPFYCRWPLTAALLDPVTRRPVWSGDFDADIRSWVPGDRWDDTRKTYSLPAPTCPFAATFRLPDGLANGQYALALAIRDPADGQPAVRFAIEPVAADLWHDVGTVNVLSPSPTVGPGPHDLTAWLEFVCDPSAERWGTGSAAARSVLDLAVQTGRIFPGMGNWDGNSGPVYMMAIDPRDFSCTKEHVAGTESCETLRVFGGRLYVPATDLKDGHASAGYLFTRSAQGVWQTRTAPFVDTSLSTHVWDYYVFKGRHFAAGYGLATSADGVAAWKDACPGKKGTGSRFVSFIACGDELFAREQRSISFDWKTGNLTASDPGFAIYPVYYRWNAAKELFEAKTNSFLTLNAGLMRSDYALGKEKLANVANCDGHCWHATPFKDRCLYILGTGAKVSIGGTYYSPVGTFPAAAISAWAENGELKGQRVTLESGAYPYDFAVVGDAIYVLSVKYKSATQNVEHGIWRSTDGIVFAKILTVDFQQVFSSFEYCNGYLYFGTAYKNALPLLGTLCSGIADKAGSIYRVKAGPELVPVRPAGLRISIL